MEQVVISRFRDRYAFLSNFYRVPIVMDGYTYPSVEHAFQASKTLITDQRRRIGMAATPGEAKRRGRLCTLRDGWDEMRNDVMLSLLRQKFSRLHSELIHQLILTAPAELREENTWGDRYWGTVDNEGANWLGFLLMQVRSELIVAGA